MDHSTLHILTINTTFCLPVQLNCYILLFMYMSVYVCVMLNSSMQYFPLVFHPLSIFCKIYYPSYAIKINADFHFLMASTLSLKLPIN
jgi:hypothetical protein